ncbi:hypothetical protein HNQ53_002992 [Microbulbifer hydrolyticus]|uniref:Uncharacterized protein n=1 Tax=Microbulbifer hydrolyticus TaxID=48074 RepID=A0AA89PJS5_9GAMM|nr:hypothetical protein [Microbulbifer hydrolyticus]
MTSRFSPRGVQVAFIRESRQKGVAIQAVKPAARLFTHQ